MDANKQPEVTLGTMVLYYRDPLNLRDPQLGFVSQRPGASTVTVSVMTGTGFVEKTSVRYKDDPGLRENEAWRQWGCWDLTDTEKMLRRVSGLSASIIAASERQKR